MKWLDYLMLFGGIQGLIFCTALLTILSRGKRNVTLSFVLLLFVVSVFLLIFSQYRHFGEYPKLFLPAYFLIYLYGPAFYLFVKAMYEEDFTWKPKYLWYGLPAVLFLLLLSRYMLFTDAEILHRLHTGDYIDLTITDAICILANMLFLRKSWHLLNVHAKAGQSKGALKALVVVLLISSLAWFNVLLPQFGIHLLPVGYPLTTVYLIMSLLIFVFGYFVIIRSGYFYQLVSKEEPYKKLTIDSQELKGIEEKILTTLQQERPYLNPDFSLQDMASLTGIDKFKISLTLSRGMNTNFTSLVNQYRIEAFINLVNSRGLDNFNQMGIAMESGFNSKSTFYKAFKELKGVTPKTYFKEMVGEAQQI